MGREVLIVKIEYVVRPDPWCLKTHMENFSRIEKVSESQCSNLGCCFLLLRRGKTIFQKVTLQTRDSSLEVFVEIRVKGNKVWLFIVIF